MTNMLKYAALAAVAIAAPAVAQTLPPAVIVVVDMDQVFKTSAAGKLAQTELQGRADRLQARLQALTTQYGTEEQALQKSQPAQGAAAAAITAWQNKVRDEQTRKQKDQADLNKGDQDLQLSSRSVGKQLSDAASPIIAAIMKERGATIALAEGATLAHAQAIDVSTDVIARLDKALPRVSTATPTPTK